MNKKIVITFLLAAVCLSSCRHTSEKLEPRLNYAVQDKYLKSLPSPFPALSEAEKRQDWAREYQIGIGFAHQLDLYQAMTAFKRADILIENSSPERKQQILYTILLSYYLGKKYQDVVYTYESTDLRYVNNSFPAFRDLLVILYDAFTQLGEDDKALRVLQAIQQYYPETGETLSVSDLLYAGNVEKLNQYATEKSSAPYLNDFLAHYEAEKKSIPTAKTLNALLPGAGYFYLGQKQSAFTALMLNGLFIAASYIFFHNGNIPAGVIFTSFETGWYFGGIIGAGQEAKLYNERVYEKYATPMMNEQRLFPVLSLKYAF